MNRIFRRAVRLVLLFFFSVVVIVVWIFVCFYFLREFVPTTYKVIVTFLMFVFLSNIISRLLLLFFLEKE
jgi:hypothetical protein